MLKILFVEDDPMISEIYDKKFRSAGFEIVCVTTGSEALSALEKNEFDLVLLDLVLPEMTGIEILKKIRKNEKIADTKVAVFSNLGEEEYAKEAEKLGAVAYITKSAYTPTEAVVEVDKLLERVNRGRVTNE